MTGTLNFLHIDFALLVKQENDKILSFWLIWRALSWGCSQISAAEGRTIMKFGMFIEPIEKDFLAQNLFLKIIVFFVIMQIYANYMHKLHFNWYKIHLKVSKLEICFSFVANLFDKFLKRKKIKIVFEFLMYSIVF